MAGEDDARRNAEFGANRTALRRALCTAVDPVLGVATFNVNGGVQSAPMMGFPPAVNVDAWLLYVGDVPLCLGPVYRSPWGVVTAPPDAGKVTVLGDDGVEYTVPYADSLDLDTDDRAAIDWTSGVATSEPASDQDSETPVGPGGGGGEARSATFSPTGSASYLTTSGSWWTSQVRCGDTNLGCYFFGTQIMDSIPDTATVTAVYLDLVGDGTGGNPTWGLHTLTGTTGAPDTTGAFEVPAGSGRFQLPTAYGDALQTGAALGVGTNHGGNHIYAQSAGTNSGALTIEYTT